MNETKQFDQPKLVTEQDLHLGIPKAPDKEHRGCINYTIKWRDGKAYFDIENITYEDRCVIMYQAHEDLEVLLANMKYNPEKIKEHFTMSEKAGIQKARFMLDKFLLMYLRPVVAKMFAPVTPVTDEQIAAKVQEVMPVENKEENE